MAPCYSALNVIRTLTSTRQWRCWSCGSFALSGRLTPSERRSYLLTKYRWWWGDVPGKGRVAPLPLGFGRSLSAPVRGREGKIRSLQLGEPFRPEPRKAITSCRRHAVGLPQFVGGRLDIHPFDAG
jgi:hypothetical protein